MTEKTRVRLGAYFLFALLLLALPISLAVTHHETVAKATRWVRSGDSVRLVASGDRERAVQWARKEYHLSKDGAERFVRQQELRTGRTLDTSHSVPYGAQIDYYSVGSEGGRDTARFQGSALVTDPRSEAARAYVSYVRDEARKKDRPEYLDDLSRILKKDALLVPLSFSQTAASHAKKPGANTVKASTTTVKIAVVCTRLPGFRDIAPLGDGDSNADDTAAAFWSYPTTNVVGTSNPSSYTEYCYRQVPPLTPAATAGDASNFADTTTGGTDEPWGTGTDLGSVFDSPGGVFSATAPGYPLGISTSRWDFADEPAEPASTRNTNLEMQNFVYDTLYDPTLYSGSTADWFYRQTHGHYKLGGDATDVIGWLASAHVANRYPYQTGGGNVLFAFPGTPVIRRVPTAGADPSSDQVVRASLGTYGLTILFSHPVTSLALPTISAFTSADTDEASGTQTGTITINWGISTYERIMDPYDGRRWTITNPGGTGWKFYQADTTSPPSLTEATFVSPDNGAWTLTYGAYANLGGYSNPQRRGCPALSDTVITNADLMVCPYNATDASDTVQINTGRPFARLRSLAYYTHAYVPGQTFQLAHLNNQWGYRDDIAGSTYSVDVNTLNTGTFCKQRPAPWDHESDDPWNGGYWPRANEANAGNHKIGTYQGDVRDVLNDNGIDSTFAGYQQVIYANAGSAPDDDSSQDGFQASSALALGENLGAVTHELCHSIWGAVDLYDNDLYANGLSIPPPNPLYHMCNGMGPYSIMAAGSRIDAWHAVQHFTDKTVITEDTLGVEVPAIEGLLRDPVIIKIPGNPYYIKKGITEANWDEYYLLENHEGTSFDSTPSGLYIYHVDERSAAANNPNQAGFQRDDDVMTVIIEQADGNYELEYNNAGTVGNLNTDPFGGNTAARVTRFWQFPMMVGDTNDVGTAVQGVNAVSGSPTSYSHGYTYSERSGGTNVLIPSTATDSFVRVTNISNLSEVMTADVYVEPAEVKVTGTNLSPTTVRQGDLNVGMLMLNLDNARDTTAGLTDQSKMSTADVYVDTVKILESGTSSNGTNMSAVKLYADTTNLGTFDAPDPANPATAHDTLLATTTINTAAPDKEYAVFEDLGYRVPLGESRNVFVAYDIAPEAQVNPTITVGAEITASDEILPRLPGTVMVRNRLDANPASDNAVDMYNFGSALFPIPSDTAVVHSYPDRLVITPDITNMPTKASQGQADVPMMRLDCEVNPDGDPRTQGSVRVDSLKVEEVGSLTAVSDLTACKLYLDNGDGSFDAAGDSLLGTSSFTPETVGVDTLEVAYFQDLNLQIDAGTPRSLFLAVSVASGATTGNAAQLSIEFDTPVAQPQDDCYIQLINNVAELNANKDYVEFNVPPATWPMVSQTIDVIVPNQAPYAPIATFSPAGGASISDSTPTLTWSMPDPPDPDASDTLATLHYEVQVADNSSFTSPISGTTATNVLTWTVPGVSALAVSTDYYWRVRTVDAQDATSAWSASQTFTVVSNRAPNQITSGFAPTGDITTLTPDITWDKTTDPDASDTQDTLRYVLQIDDNSDFSSPLALTNLGAAPAWESYNVPAGSFAALSHADQNTYSVLAGDGLEWGTYYYYRVAAQDSAGTQSVWSTSRRFRPIQDRHPYTPIATFAPADDVEVETANPVISWNMPDPPDPDVTDPLDVLYYKVQLKKAVPEDNDDMTDGTIINFTTTASTADVSPADGIIDSMEWVVTQNAGGAPVNLEDDAHYYYRVRAFDDENKASDWTDVQSFWVNLVNDNPAAPTGGFDPANGEQINDSTPTMTWYAGTDPDHSDDATTLHYVVELSTAADCSTVNYQYTSTDGVASVTPTVALTDLTTWYWRVKTVDNEGAESGWSDIQNFYLDVNNSAPTLTADTVTPMYGPISTFYQLFVTYTDAENDQPGKVYCAFDGGTPQEMAKVVPGDVTATDGIRYVIGVAGTTLGLGVHTYQFTCDAPAAPLSGTGPIIGEASRIWFTDQSGAGIATYEEGQPVYLKVADNDENANPAGLDTVVVTVTETGGDSETVTLTETGVATAVFRGSLPTLGRAGADNNGTLNAIGGPSGNTLTVSYADADETGYAGQDTASTTATLYDTVAPALVAKKLVVTSGPHGRTATLNWAAYDEAAQIDVAGYNVYYSDAAFASTVGLTPYVGLTAGTQTIDVSGLTPNKAYWFAVAPFDEKPNERTTLTPVKLTTRDTSAPVISGESPARGATEVALDSTVSFTLDDAGVGIDRKSLVVNLTQNGAAVARGPLTVTGDKSRMTITATPTANFDWNGVVTVSIDVMDLDGNELVVNDWTFSLVADTEVPTLDTQSPAANATNVPISSSISFHLKDTTSGIDQSSVRVSVNGVNVTSSLSFSGTAADTTVLYDPADDLLYSSTYTVSVTARDVAGNALSPSPATWSFDTVLDSTGVVIDQYDPARSATDVPITTNIGMRLSDPQAGIQVGSFRMWVQNVEVTSDAGLTIAQTPATGATATTMLVSYNPSEDLPYSTDIQVRLYVRDGVGNITDLTYKFTTSDAPTYNISGEITQPSGAALAGVTVTAGGKTAVSDGNGAYRITGLLAGTYVVTPTRDEYVFTPENQTVVLGGTNDDAGDVDFQGELQTYSVSGTVKLGKTALGGVSVTCNGQTVVTAANGTYTISGLANGQYTVTPALANYHFQPTSRAAQVAGASVTGVDFAAIADTFTIAGTVYDNSGNRLQGVTVTTGSKTAVTNAAGQYILTGLVANTYTLAATKTGYAFSPTTQDVTVPASATGVDFTAYVNMSTTFPGGFNLIGIPGTPADSDPTKVFLQSDGTPVVQCYRWNPDATPPQYLVAINDGSAAAMQVKPGRGYFVRFNESTALNVAGTPTNATKSTSIGLSEGWNMIANPTSSPLKWSKFVPTVEDGIRPFAFVYDTVSGSYKMVSDEAAVNADRDTLLGWEGAWVRALSSGVSLTVTGTTTTAAEPVCKPAQASLNGGWVIPVVAKAGRRADYTSVAGVVPGSAGSYTIENPPTAPATVDVYFTDTAGTRLAHDIRTEDGAQTFNFVVSCAVADTQVAVTLPDLSKVPANMQVTLVDEETGKSTYARTMQSYTYQSKGDSSARKFRLVVSPRTTSALAVTAAAASTRGQGVMVTYNVTKACQVSIRVLNLAGRTVKTLAAGQTVTAGVQSQLWNLSSENGTTVPAGTYLLQIDAATDDGQQVRGLTQVRVAR